MYDENKWTEVENQETKKEEQAAEETVSQTADQAVEGQAANHTVGQTTNQAAGGQSASYTASQPSSGQSKNQASDRNSYQYDYYQDEKREQARPNQQSYSTQQSYSNQQSYSAQQTRSTQQRQPQYQQSSHHYQTYSYQQPQNGGRTPKKKGSFLKKAAAVTAAALLFGVVAGASMFGVNRAGELLFPMETQTTETQAPPETLGTTDVITTPQETKEATTTSVVLEDVSPIVEAAMPSVVAINNTTLYQSSTWFGQTQTYEIPSSGSGIIIGENDTELLIVTNNHVIEDANTLTVTFIDESTVDAAVKGTDSVSDLAVIAVPLEKIAADTKAQIKVATLGDSDELKMGQGVIAIGNALGLGQSVTVGHVSALDREITVDGNVKKVIQTDAAINPGNSGGALLNSKGELIGINEAKYADESVEGVGYAIPISHAKDIIDDLKLRTTKVEVAESEQGYLGIQVQNVDSSTAKMLGMPEGVYVYKITEGSAAAASDLREKDIITKFDGETVKTNADLTTLLTYYKAGTTVTLTVQSLENGAYVERQVDITLKNRPIQDETIPK